MTDDTDPSTATETALSRRLLALGSENRVRILAAVSLGWALGLGVRLSLPVVMPWIQRDFEIGLTGVGGLLSLVWVLYAVSQFPGGVIGDRFGERNVLVGSTFAAAVALAVVGLSTDFRLFLAGIALFGLGSGLYATTRFTVLSDVYPDNDGTALGVSAAAGNVGSAVLPVVVGQVALLVGWRFGFFLVVPVLLAVGAGLAWSVPARTSRSVTETDDRHGAVDLATFVRAVARPGPLLGTATMFLMSFVYQAFTGFYPTYLVQVKGLDEGTAALLYGAFFTAAILVQPVGGVIGDRYGKRRTMLVAGLLTAAVLALVPTVQGLPPLLALSALASVQLAFWPNAQAYVIAVLPERFQGSGFGLLRTAYLSLAATGPLVVGALASAGAFDASFYVIAAAAGVTIPLGLILATVGASGDGA